MMDMNKMRIARTKKSNGVVGSTTRFALLVQVLVAIGFLAAGIPLVRAQEEPSPQQVEETEITPTVTTTVPTTAVLGDDDTNTTSTGADTGTTGPTDKQTPSPSISPGPTQIPYVMPTWEPTEPCNICGEGNEIGAPDQTFKFFALEGNQRELGCQQVQDLIYSNNAPPGWCEKVSEQAIVPCECRTPDGTPVPPPPTVAIPFCNICGEPDSGNFIGEVGAVVNLEDHEGLIRKFPCTELQRLANTPNIFPGGFCGRIQEQTLRPCRCTTPDGVLLSDLLEPTHAPIEGGLLPDGTAPGADTPPEGFGDGTTTGGEDGTTSSSEGGEAGTDEEDTDSTSSSGGTKTMMTMPDKSKFVYTMAVVGMATLLLPLILGRI